MATKDYNFQYTPLTGRLPGNSFVKQTEQAINELAGIVNEGSAQVEVITNLANTANNNAEEALEKANEALETAGRVYITLPNLDDADSYFDSQLYYFANSYSHNLPVQATGFLEVKTNDTKTACEQVFIADLTGLCYFRHGTITSAEIGSETVYSVTWDIWSSALASKDYVQQEVNVEANRADSKFLPLSGGTLTGVVNGVTPTAGDDTTKLATTAYVQEEIRRHGNLPVGHEYFSMNPNVPQGSLPLIGGVYSRETYADLWAWVQTQSGYLKTEAEWQTLSTANNGNVPYYSSGDGSTTFRVPSLHCWIKGSDGSAQLVGSYLEAGLPNITGSVSKLPHYDQWTLSGAFAKGTRQTDSGNFLDGNGLGGLTFNASLSNPIYGNSTTVQPESIVGMWLVKCYGTIADTGQIDEQQYIDDRMQALRTEMAQGDVVSAPVGCVQAFAGSSTPSGWLFCDGSAVSRITYADLYSVIGDTYGAGDGSTTFNLPNLTDKFIQGNAVAGTEHSAGLPNITGSVGNIGSVEGSHFGLSLEDANFGGALYLGDTTDLTNDFTISSVTPLNKKRVMEFNASRSSAIYGNSNTVQPPSVTMRYIIKY